MPFWKKIPLKFVIIGGVVLAIALVGWIAGRGKTDAQDLEPGDCFEQPSGLDNISEVKDQSCDGLHETEIYARAFLLPGDTYPGDYPFGGLEPQPADEACDSAAEPLDINIENIPDDFQVGYFFADRSDFDGGDRSLLCYIYSPSGLLGPVVNRAG